MNIANITLASPLGVCNNYSVEPGESMRHQYSRSISFSGTVTEKLRNQRTRVNLHSSSLINHNQQTTHPVPTDSSQNRYLLRHPKLQPAFPTVQRILNTTLYENTPIRIRPKSDPYHLCPRALLGESVECEAVFPPFHSPPSDIDHLPVRLLFFHHVN